MTDENTTALVKEVLEELRVGLQSHGGDMEVVAIDYPTVRLRLVGACGACPHALMTLKSGIERALHERVSTDIVVERVED